MAEAKILPTPKSLLFSLCTDSFNLLRPGSFVIKFHTLFHSSLLIKDSMFGWEITAETHIHTNTENTAQIKPSIGTLVLMTLFVMISLP